MNILKLKSFKSIFVVVRLVDISQIFMATGPKS